MLWPATHVHARAARVLPSRSTVFYSSVCGPRGVLVPSQTGGATYGVSRRAFLSGQDLVSARSSFVARPLRSSCRKLPGVLTVLASPNVPTTVWVKRMDVAGARYVDLENVDLEQTVSKFIARWVAQAKLDIDLSLVTLRLVNAAGVDPTADEEKQAVELRPRQSLAEAGITDGCSLLVIIAAFWLQLPNATVSDKVLRLVGGTTFLGSSTLLDRMYIRDDYVGLWSEIQRLMSSGLSRIVVSGNPGIGKSWFGLYVAYQLLSRKSPPVIVWEARLSGTRTLIRDGRVLDGSLDDFRTELSNTSAWYLVDEAIFPGAMRVEANTLVFSSPKRDNYRLTLKASASTIRYLPPWSWEEIEACHALLYADDPTRPLSDVKAAYERWGGIPRLVLEQLRDEGAQLLLQEAIDTADVRGIWNSAGQIDAAPEASHRLLYIQVQRPYVRKSVTFGTRYIVDCLLNRFLEQQESELSRFLISSASSANLGPLRGDVFEGYAHRVLRNGGDFRVRCLNGPDAGTEDTLHLACCDGVYSIREPADLAKCPSDAHYCKPVYPNFPAVDALMLPGNLFQMTVSKTHSVKHAALKRVLEQLPDVSPYNLYFVVPEDIYPSFCAQQFVRADDASKTATVLDARVKRVQQWALCISLHRVPQLR